MKGQVGWHDDDDIDAADHHDCGLHFRDDADSISPVFHLFRKKTGAAIYPISRKGVARRDFWYADHLLLKGRQRIDGHTCRSGADFDRGRRRAAFLEKADAFIHCRRNCVLYAADTIFLLNKTGKGYSMENAIEIKGLNKKYRDFSLADINFSLPEGSILGLVGENGAGKSTTINLIMNAISRDSGTITVLGTDNQSKDFLRVKEDIGVVLDEAYFPPVISAANVNSIMKYTYQNWNEQEYFSYLKKFELPEKKMFKDYSRGMKMKLAIAAALSHGSKLLILDEATSGLDPIVREEILDIFKEFAAKGDRSILLSSHIVSDLEKLCDYIAFIHKGKLMFCEKKEKLLKDYELLGQTTLEEIILFLAKKGE